MAFPRLALRNPRTECDCQPVAFMISARVAPSALRSMASTAAFLLPRRAAGFGRCFTVLTFFCFRRAGRDVLSGAAVVAWSFSSVVVFFMVISWTTRCGQDMDHSVRPHKQVNSEWRTQGDPGPVWEDLFWSKSRLAYSEETHPVPHQAEAFSEDHASALPRRSPSAGVSLRGSTREFRIFRLARSAAR